MAMTIKWQKVIIKVKKGKVELAYLSFTIKIKQIKIATNEISPWSQ